MASSFVDLNVSARHPIPGPQGAAGCGDRGNPKSWSATPNEWQRAHVSLLTAGVPLLSKA
jgi:hypothetical protein